MGYAVSAIDVSQEMIDISQALCEQHGIEADLAIGDCEDMEYPDGHFDEHSQQVVAEIEDLCAYSSYGGLNYTVERTDLRRISLDRQDGAQIKTAVLSGMP